MNQALPVIKIWHAGDQNSANWCRRGIGKIYRYSIADIPNAGTAAFLNLPESIKRILRLDKPDLILTARIGGVDVPIVSIEITLTTPQSQHAKQRIPRIVAAAEAGVPAMYIILGRKHSGGSMYRLGADLYVGMERIRQINTVPTFVYTFPDRQGVPFFDQAFPNQPNLTAPSMTAAFNTIRVLIRDRLTGAAVSQLFADPHIRGELATQDAIAAAANAITGNYDSLELVQTLDLRAYLCANTNMSPVRVANTLAALPDRIIARRETLFFKPGGRLLDHANDPYSGMLAFFDYVFCRTGRGVEDRSRNLVYMPTNEHISNITDEFAPSGYQRFWEERCPLSNGGVPSVAEQFSISHHLQYGCVFTKTKPLRVLSYFSDLIVFQDSVLVF